MQLKKVSAYIDKYAQFLNHPASDSNLYIWESLAIFRQQWDLNTNELRQMYDSSFQNSTTRRLWKRDNYAPKEMMLKFIQMEAEYVRHALTDLLDEKKDIEGRVDRFVFYCDQFLQQYKEEFPLKIDNNHYHSDYWMISIYLAFEYPTQYAPYDSTMFRESLRKLGSLDVPKVSDIGRFFKVSRTLQKLLLEHETVVKNNRNRIVDKRLYKE
ncbi:MAG: hypothetical protein AAGK47_10380, partial [Bacteroidota bacterium]